MLLKQELCGDEVLQRLRVKKQTWDVLMDSPHGVTSVRLRLPIQRTTPNTLHAIKCYSTFMTVDINGDL